MKYLRSGFQRILLGSILSQVGSCKGVNLFAFFSDDDYPKLPNFWSFFCCGHKKKRNPIINRSAVSEDFSKKWNILKHSISLQ